jgi:chaperonin GroES
MAQAQKENASNTKFKPLGNRVLLRRLEAEETLKGGILLPDSAKKKQEQAEVIAIGPGQKDKQGNPMEMPVKVGDVVLMDKYSGQEITIEDQEYVIVKADDLIAIVTQ